MASGSAYGCGAASKMHQQQRIASISQQWLHQGTTDRTWEVEKWTRKSLRILNSFKMKTGSAWGVGVADENLKLHMDFPGQRNCPSLAGLTQKIEKLTNQMSG
eukprot:1158942-Pelagomonas_calceolata.AAC.2